MVINREWQMSMSLIEWGKSTRRDEENGGK